MGEISDAIVEGEICQVCTCPFTDSAPGFPRTCTECGGPKVDYAHHKEATPTTLYCPLCRRGCKGAKGFADHARDAHKTTAAAIVSKLQVPA